MGNEKTISDKWTTDLLKDAVCLDGEDGKTKKENIKPKKEKSTPAPVTSNWPY